MEKHNLLAIPNGLLRNTDMVFMCIALGYFMSILTLSARYAFIANVQARHVETYFTLLAEVLLRPSMKEEKRSRITRNLKLKALCLLVWNMKSIQTTSWL